MDFEKIKFGVSLFSHINEMSHYVTKERFDLAAKVKYNLEDEKKLDRLYGLFNQACQALHLFARPDLQSELSLAVNIAEAAYVKDEIYKFVPSVKDDSEYQKDVRKYFYTVEGSDSVLELIVNLRDAENIILLAELVKRNDVKLRSAVEYLGKLRSGRQDKEYPYFEGDIVFLYGDPTDRVFYDWYRTDAGVYLATNEGWRKLQYVRGRGYLGKDGEPEYENDKHFSDYKLEDYGRGFRFVGNIHKDATVLVDKPEEE